MTTAQVPRKNVVMFLTDGHRADTVGCYGNPIVQTPNLDRFAGDGVRCTGAFASHSVCMPTRASVFTGRYPHAHGVWTNGVPLPRDEVTLAQVLARNGYRTCACGKIHFEPQQAPAHPPDFDGMEDYYGFQEVHLNENKQGPDYLKFVDERFPGLSRKARRRAPIPEEAHELTWVTDQAIGFIERQAQGESPFFCFCSFHELIPPCHPPIGFHDLYSPEDMPMPKRREGELDAKPPYYRQCREGELARGWCPDDDRYRQIMAGYYSQATFLDKQFGRLLDTLDRLGIADDTIVLFTSDHGLVLNDHWLWRHGPFLYDQVINVPLIWRVPGRAGGRVWDGLCEGVDIMPTLLELVGAECPANVQGQSMRPALLGDSQAEGKESVLAQDREHPDLWVRGVDPTGRRSWCLRTKEWKLIQYPGKPYGELYDLKSDPDEYESLWAEPHYREKRRELEGMLDARITPGRDPLSQRRYRW